MTRNFLESKSDKNRALNLLLYVQSGVDKEDREVKKFFVFCERDKDEKEEQKQKIEMFVLKQTRSGMFSICVSNGGIFC
jgi:hypothetical protein